MVAGFLPDINATPAPSDPPPRVKQNPFIYQHCFQLKKKHQYRIVKQHKVKQIISPCLCIIGLSLCFCD